MKHRYLKVILPGLACLTLMHGAARHCMAAATDARPAQVDSTQEEAGTRPAQIDRLRTRLRDVERIRILTQGTSLLAGAPTVSSEGILARDITVRSGFGYRTETMPRMIPWAEIESVQIRSGHTTRNGALIGAVAGTLIGIAISTHQPCTPGTIFGGPGNCAERQITPIWAGALGGAVIGALAGNRYDRWQLIYP